MMQEIYERSPMRVFQYLEGGLEAGQLGVILARTGVGKSALLVHLALDALLRDVAVLHVALRDTVDHVRSYYDEIFRAVSRTAGVRDRAAAMVSAERHRMIHSYRERRFDVGQLRSNLSMLRDIAHFEPQLVVIDGMDAAGLADQVDGLIDLASDLGLRIWATASLRSEQVDPVELCGRCAIALRLVPEGSSVRILLDREGESRELPVALDPTTMLVVGEGGEDHAATPSPRASDCTMYSGGANGSEAAFGEAAERWGVHEVNFTFEGHRQSRSRGRYELSPRELAAGDVSLVYVSRRLSRTYSHGSLIRKVLQTLWHMVSRSQQVFVVGSIQKDGTVVGGTGWSVELARMWNKSLWVYDQDKLGWYWWDGNDWVPGTPVVDSVHFTGTGTRYLTDEGRQAVDDLFARSFGEDSD